MRLFCGGDEFLTKGEYDSTRIGSNLIKGSALDNVSQSAWDTSGATANWTDHLVLLQNDVLQNIYVTPNTTYTFSFVLDYLDTSAPDIGFYFVEQKDNNTNTDPYKDNQYTWATGKIKNVAGLHTFYFTTGAECHLLIMHIRYRGSNPNGFQLRKVKLEKGDAATPWCLAPEEYAIKSDLDALKAKEDSIAKNLINYVPHVNLLQNSAGPFFPQAGSNNTDQTGQTDVNATDQWQAFTNSTVTLVKGETYTVSAATNGVFSNNHDPNNASNKCVIWIGPPVNMVISGENTSANTFTWNSDTGTYPLRVNRYGKDSTVKCWNVKIEHGSQATDWTPCPLDS